MASASAQKASGRGFAPRHLADQLPPIHSNGTYLIEFQIIRIQIYLLSVVGHFSIISLVEPVA